MAKSSKFFNKQPSDMISERERTVILVPTKTVIDTNSVIHKLFTNFPSLQIMDEKVITKFSTSFYKIIDSIRPEDISSNFEIVNQEKAKVLLNWLTRVMSASHSSVLDRRCLLQARVASELNWQAGHDIYDLENSRAVLSSFVKILIQKLMDHAFPEQQKPQSLQATDAFLSMVLTPKIVERVKVKPFKNSSDYLGNILEEFVAAPVSLRTNADYLLLCDVFETLRDDKEMPAHEFKQILLEAHARCGDEGVLIIIMQKHLDLLDSPRFSLDATSSSPRLRR